MKKFLIVVVILGYTGFFISAAQFAMRKNELRLDEIISWIALIAVNLLCSAWLYKKADNNKVEWALFGVIGNLTALISFWLFKDVIDNWKRGKRNFS
jgi:drug/metabolite transporter (DMT)-like permease